MTDRICSNCRFCEVGSTSLMLFCKWEDMTLPPPVHRTRNWGSRPPRTEDPQAESCAQYSPGEPRHENRKSR